MDSEKMIQSSILKFLNKLPRTWVVKYPAGVYGKTGAPDILVCCNGKFVAMEVKTEEGRQTEMQKLMQQRIRAAGGTCEVVRSVDDAIEVMKEVTSGS